MRMPRAFCNLLDDAACEVRDGRRGELSEDPAGDSGDGLMGAYGSDDAGWDLGDVTGATGLIGGADAVRGEEEGGTGGEVVMRSERHSSPVAVDVEKRNEGDSLAALPYILVSW